MASSGLRPISPKQLGEAKTEQAGRMTSLGKVTGRNSKKSSVSPATPPEKGQPDQPTSGLQQQQPLQQSSRTSVIARTPGAASSGKSSPHGTQQPAAHASGCTKRDASARAAAAAAASSSDVRGSTEVTKANAAGQPAAMTHTGSHYQPLSATEGDGIAVQTPVVRSGKRPASGDSDNETKAGKKAALLQDERLDSDTDESGSCEIEPSSDDNEESLLVVDTDVDEHPQSVEMADDDFTLVVGKNKNKKNKRANRPNQEGRRASGNAANPDKGRAAKCTVYMSGRNGHDLAKEVAYSRARDFKKAVEELVGPGFEMQLFGRCVKIQAADEQQAERLLQLSAIGDLEVVVTPRRSTGKSGSVGNTNHDSWKKGVIKRVPRYVELDLIKSETGATWASRISRQAGGQQTPTGTVILAFCGADVPDTVSVGLARFKVLPYIPLPLRCGKCQKFGHKTTKCRATAPTCAKCAKSHGTSECQVTAQNEMFCTNCRQQHSSAYRGCIKYKEVSKILTIGAKKNLSYAEAAKSLTRQERAKKREITAKTAAGSRPQSNGVINEVPDLARRVPAGSRPATVAAATVAAPAAAAAAAAAAGGAGANCWKNTARCACTAGAGGPSRAGRRPNAVGDSAAPNVAQLNEGTPTAVSHDTSESLLKKLQEVIQPLAVAVSWLIGNLQVAPAMVQQHEAIVAQLANVAAAVGVPQSSAVFRRRSDGGQTAQPSAPVTRSQTVMNAKVPDATVSLRPGGSTPRSGARNGSP